MALTADGNTLAVGAFDEDGAATEPSNSTASVCDPHASQMNGSFTGGLSRNSRAADNRYMAMNTTLKIVATVSVLAHAAAAAALLLPQR